MKKSIVIYFNEELSIWINYNPRVTNIIESFKKEGYEVDIITRNSKNNVQVNNFLKKYNVIIIPKKYGVLRTVKFISSVLKKKEYAVHYAINLYAGIIFSFINLFMKKPFFYDCMELFTELETNYYRKKLVSFVEAFVFNSSKKVIVVSNERRAFLVKKFSFTKHVIKSVTVNNFLQQSKSAISKSAGSDLKKRGIDPNKILFVYIGSIKKSRGIDDLIRAFSELNSKKSQLLLVGLDTDNVLDQHVPLPANIVYLGSCTRQELDKIKSYFDVGIISLKNENYNNYYAANFKFSEYLNEGYVLLAPDFPVYKKLVTKKIGRLCDFSDINSIKKGIIEIEKKDITSSKKHSLVLSKKYSWDNEFKTLLRFIEDCNNSLRR